MGTHASALSVRLADSRASRLQVRIDRTHACASLVSSPPGRPRVACTGQDQPRRDRSERRIKRSAMVDLARLASSLHGLAFGVREDWVRQMQLTGDAADNLRAAEAAWRSACWQAFLTPYRAAVTGQLLVPDDDAEFAEMFGAFRLSAAIETLLQALELKRTDRLAGALDDCLEQVPAT